MGGSKERKQGNAASRSICRHSHLKEHSSTYGLYKEDKYQRWARGRKVAMKLSGNISSEEFQLPHANEEQYQKNSFGNLRKFRRIVANGKRTEPFSNSAQMMISLMPRKKEQCHLRDKILHHAVIDAIRFIDGQLQEQ